MKLADERGLLFPYYLLDEFYGQPSAGYLQFLLNNYNSKTFASEFMFHLGDSSFRLQMNDLLASGKDDKVLPGINFKYFDNRERELTELVATPLPSLVKNKKIQLATFRDLNVDDSLEPR